MSTMDQKSVLVSLVGRNRPVAYVGGQKNLTAATKEAYQDVLLAINRLEPKLFFQLLEN